MVLPLVASYLSDAEWHGFMFAARAKRAPRERVEFLTWVLDDATAEDSTVVLREVPAPGRLVYRLFLRKRYDRSGPWAKEAQPGVRDSRMRDASPSALRSA